MTNLARNRSGERGAAITETVIMMLVLIPLILYSIFTSDLVANKLDVQEMVTSSVWDYSFRNFEKEAHANIISEVWQQNRKLWCDNSVLFNDDPDGADCTNPPRQEGFMAKMVYEGDKQIKCDRMSGGKDVGADGYNLAIQQFHSDYTTGGGFQCEATGTVYNFWVPEKFEQNFENNDLSKFKNHKGEDIRSIGGGSGPKIEMNEKFTIFVDSWALSNTREVKRDDSGPNSPYVDRVWEQFSYLIWYGPAAAATDLFAIQALSDKEAVIPAIPFEKIDGTLDWLIGTNPLSLHMVSRHPVDNQESVGGWWDFSKDDFYVTDYKDWDADEPKKTFDNRDDHFLGCKTAQSPDYCGG